MRVSVIGSSGPLNTDDEDDEETDDERDDELDELDDTDEELDDETEDEEMTCPFSAALYSAITPRSFARKYAMRRAASARLTAIVGERSIVLKSIS